MKYRFPLFDSPYEIDPDILFLHSLYAEFDTLPVSESVAGSWHKLQLVLRYTNAGSTDTAPRRFRTDREPEQSHT